MKRLSLPVFLLLTAVSCSDKKYEADIIRLFGLHSYEEHSPQRILELLRSEGAAGLRRLDGYAGIINAGKRFKRDAAESPAASSGLLIGSRGGGFYVLRAFRQSPAETAGFRDGDKILEVNGIAADAQTLTRELPSRGEFRLKVERQTGDRRRFEASVKKTEFSFPVIFGFYEPATRTAFVRIGVFFEGAGGMVLSGLGDLVRAGAKKVLFDLRDNKGGMPAEAAAILASFTAKAGPVLELKSRHKGYSRRFDAPGKGRFAGLKTAVLVSGETAMAAEAFAAALNDVAGAVIAGCATKGNVSLQKTFRVGGSGKKFQLTVARLFAPSGRDLEGTGVAPDHKVEFSKERAGGLKKAWDSSSETVLLDDPFYGEALKAVNK